jgi:tRNA A37 N6-isopentenylltransferase MiaA
MNKVNALQSLRPNAEWTLNGDDLEWLDKNQTQPTDAEIQAEVTRLQAEYDAQEYARKRAVEYPNMADYLDGVVKGDQAQMDKYIADCLAVKAKYPKPEAQ